MDPSLAEKKRKMKSPTHQVSASNRVICGYGIKFIFNIAVAIF